MATASLEDRISALEVKFSELSRDVAKLSGKATSPAADTQIPWWERIVGIYENDPAFDEAERYRLEYRESLDREDNESSS